MKYKALMSDVDGTIVPYDYKALPSNKVIEALAKAKEKLPITLVTGRGYTSIQSIIEKLNLSEGYAVVNNGAYVIDLKTEEVIYEKYISSDDFSTISQIFEKEKVPFFLKQSQFDTRDTLNPYVKGMEVKKVSMVFAEELFPSEKIESILEQLSSLSNISANKQHHKFAGKFGISISHSEATKLHGVYEVAKKLDLDPKTFIGVGDSYNDFPLLMACGLKVAMGNAAEDLKAIADYIAPSVNDDGIVDVIEQFILNDKQ